MGSGAERAMVTSFNVGGLLPRLAIHGREGRTIHGLGALLKVKGKN